MEFPIVEIHTDMEIENHYSQPIISTTQLSQSQPMPLAEELKETLGTLGHSKTTIEPTKEPLDLNDQSDDSDNLPKHTLVNGKGTEMEEENINKNIEPVQSRTTTVVDDKPDDPKDKMNEEVSNNDDKINEEAIRELDELFNSDREEAKDSVTPVKEAAPVVAKPEPKKRGRKKLSDSSKSAKSGSTKKGDETPKEGNKEPKKRGRKRLNPLPTPTPTATPTTTETITNTHTKQSATKSDKYDYLEGKNPLFEVTSDRRYIIPNSELTHEQLKERYEEIVYKFSHEGEVACLVCLDDESFTDDDIILCDLCDSAFHQSCYGSDLLDLSADNAGKKWYCQRCDYLLHHNLPPHWAKCTFCPELKGPIKKVRESRHDQWAHIVCVNWIPEIYYQDEAEKQNVFITDYRASHHYGRKSLNCTFCKIKYGDPIQCDNEKCIMSFHVTCAQRHGLICNWKKMNGLKRDHDEEYYSPIYCKKHMKQYSQEMFDYSNLVEEIGKERGSEISCLHDPHAPPNKIFHIPKKSSKVKEKDVSEEIDKINLNVIQPSNTESRLRKRKGSVNKNQHDMTEETFLEITDLKETKPSKEAKPRTESKRRNRRVLEFEEDSKIDNETKASDTDKISKAMLEEVSDSTLVKVPLSAEKESEAKKGRSSKRKAIALSPPEEKPEVKEKETRQYRKRAEKAEKAVKKAEKVSDKIAKEIKVAKIDKVDREEKVDKVNRSEKIDMIDKVDHVEKIDKVDRVSKVVEKPIDTSKLAEKLVEKSDHKPSSGLLLYKFRPNMAKLLKFNGWGGEKEIKKVISDYIKSKGLFRKDLEELDVSKDPELEDIMGLDKIPRKKIFEEFAHFMLTKSPEEVLNEDNHHNHSPFFSPSKDDLVRTKGKENHSPEKIMHVHSSRMEEEENKSQDSSERKIKKKAAFLKPIDTSKQNKEDFREKGKGNSQPPRPVVIDLSDSPRIKQEKIPPTIGRKDVDTVIRKEVDTVVRKEVDTIVRREVDTVVRKEVDTIVRKDSNSNGMSQNMSQKSNENKSRQEKQQSTLDFFNWKPKPVTDENHNSLNSLNLGLTNGRSNENPKKFGLQNDFGELTEPPIQKKVRSNPPPPIPKSSGHSSVLGSILGDLNLHEQNPSPPQRKNNYEGLGPLINAVDKMPFRKPMGWFVRTDTAIIVPSINSQAALQRFWPKGSELLF